jgi:WD40 repeat protein
MEADMGTASINTNINIEPFVKELPYKKPFIGKAMSDITEGEQVAGIVGTGWDKMADRVSILSPPPSAGTVCKFSPDGRYLAVGMNTPPWFVIYDYWQTPIAKLPPPNVIPSFPRPADGVTDLQFTPDSKFLGIVGGGSSEIFVYNVSDSTIPTFVPQNINFPEVSTTASFTKICFTPNGKWLFVGGSGGRRNMLSIDNGILSDMRGLVAAGDFARSNDRFIDISPDSKLLYIYSMHGNSRFHGFYNISSGSPILAFNTPSPTPNWGGYSFIHDGRFSPDGKFMVCIPGADRVVPPFVLGIFDDKIIEMPPATATIPGNISKAYISWSPDSKFFAITGINSPFMFLFDINDGTPIRVNTSAAAGTSVLKRGNFHPSGDLFVAPIGVSPFLTALRTISEDSIIPANFNEAAWMSNNPTFFGGFGFAGENANKGDITAMNVLDFY